MSTRRLAREPGVGIGIPIGFRASFDRVETFFCGDCFASLAMTTFVLASSPPGGGRPILNETAIVALSRRRPGSTDPPAERSKGRPRLPPEQRFTVSPSVSYLFLVRSPRVGAMRRPRTGSTTKQSRRICATWSELALEVCTP
jgi:hypothetical protein